MLKVCIWTSYKTWAGKFQSVWRLATGWSVRGSNTNGARFSAPIQTGPGAHSASYTMSTGSFPGVKRLGRGFDNPPHLAPMLKKEWSYTSTPPLGLCGLFYGDLYLYIFFYINRNLSVCTTRTKLKCSKLLMHTSTARFNGNLFSKFTDDTCLWTNRIQDIPITHLLM